MRDATCIHSGMVRPRKRSMSIWDSGEVGEWAEGKRKEGGGWEPPAVGEFEELLLGLVGH